MKTQPNYLKVGILAGILSFGTISASHAAVSVIWSGGNGSPLSCTFIQPVDFTLSGSISGSYFNFVMQGVGNETSGSVSGVTGSLTYSVDGGSNQSLASIRSGFSLNDMGPNDLFFWGYAPVSTGDTVVLNAGTLITTNSIAAAPPTNGPVNMILTDGTGSLVGTQVPEVSTTLLCGLGALGLLRRRRRLADRHLMG